MLLDLLKLLRGLVYLLLPCSLSRYPRGNVEVTVRVTSLALMQPAYTGISHRLGVGNTSLDCIA